VISEIDGQPIFTYGHQSRQRHLPSPPLEGDRSACRPRTAWDAVRAQPQHTTCPCRSEFPIDIEIPAGRQLAIVSSFDDTGMARFTLIDSATKEPVFESLTLRPPLCRRTRASRFPEGPGFAFRQQSDAAVGPLLARRQGEPLQKAQSRHEAGFGHG
jgi:hypothetical protein